jgi:hypothetical protein
VYLDTVVLLISLSLLIHTENGGGLNTVMSKFGFPYSVWMGR